VAETYPLAVVHRMLLPSFRASLLVLVGAVLTVVVADVALGRLAPLPAHPLEVENGVADYEAGDPHTLALGSSHTRSLAPLRDAIVEASGGQHQMVLVPVEWGSFSAYRWVHAEGNRKLADGALAGGLSFLRQPPPTRAASLQRQDTIAP